MAAIIRTQTPGDMNCDRRVDFNDIEGFVAALVGFSAYTQAHATCHWINADIDGDRSVSFHDIEGFIECLVEPARCL